MEIAAMDAVRTAICAVLHLDIVISFFVARLSDTLFTRLYGGGKLRNWFLFWWIVLAGLHVPVLVPAQDQCDPIYENPPCVPIASDVDCAVPSG